MADLRRISSASVLLVLGWAGLGLAFQDVAVTQFRRQPRHRPARPARVPVTSCPHPANQRPVSRPRPANHRPRFSRAPRCLWPVLGAVRRCRQHGGPRRSRAAAAAVSIVPPPAPHGPQHHAEQLVTAALLLLLQAGPSLDTGDTTALATAASRYVECRGQAGRPRPARRRTQSQESLGAAAWCRGSAGQPLLLYLARGGARLRGQRLCAETNPPLFAKRFTRK